MTVVKEFLSRLEFKARDGGLWWELYENEKEYACGTIRSSFLGWTEELCREKGIEFRPEVEAWVEEEAKKLLPEPEYDPNREMFVYYPSGLAEFNKEMDRKIVRMERRRKGEKVT